MDCEKFVKQMCNLYKNVKKCKNTKKKLIQVIHIKNPEKGGKIDVFKKLSTLSTLKRQKMGDYLGMIKERMFCEVIIKMRFCRKKPKKILTFKNRIAIIRNIKGKGVLSGGETLDKVALFEL